MLFRRLTLDEIKHGWRALHTKESSHQSAQRSCAYLHPLGCRQLDLLTEQRKIDADDYQCHTEDLPKDVVFDTFQSENGYRRDDDKRQQNRPEPLPDNMFT